MLDDSSPIETSSRHGRVSDRFGVVADAGYQPVMSVLMLHQAQLGISSEQLNVLLNISMHWFEPHTFPFPHTATIAKRMGIGPRAVQGHLRALKRKGYVNVIPGRTRTDPKRYDIRPLVKAMEPYAKERIALVGERSFDDLHPNLLEELYPS
jgi:hypothetical protein